MSKIESLGPLLAQLRSQALAIKRGSPAQGGSTTPSEPVGAPGAAAQEWLAQVAQAVQAIRKDDPQRKRKAFRHYLQALLGREYGIEQVDAPTFQELVERVLVTMESDPSLRAAVDTAGELLVRQTDPE